VVKAVAIVNSKQLHQPLHGNYLVNGLEEGLAKKKSIPYRPGDALRVSRG
jgi:hypothetical protein